jgi:hypothetical protein
VGKFKPSIKEAIMSFHGVGWGGVGGENMTCTERVWTQQLHFTSVASTSNKTKKSPFGCYD